MALQGDLSTLELADLLQNLEQHTRTGLLTIEAERGTTKLYFTAGRLGLIAFEGRARLMDVLLAAAAIDAEQLAQAKTRRKGTKKSLGEILVEHGAIEADALLAIARARLLDDACELCASESGSFEFEVGRIPRGVFDPEERRLSLELPAGPLLLEAARRSDHWEIIKNRIPSERAHYVVRKAPKLESLSNPALAGALLAQLDGTKSVSEVLCAWPHQRFEAYHLLSELLESQAVRLAGADDLARIARGLSDEDGAEGAEDRAWELVARGLSTQPQNKDLLAERTRLAQKRGETELACEGLKVLAHLELEAGSRDAARDYFERAKQLDPGDACLWEKTLELAVLEDRRADAARDGLRLVELYRAPGLHKKAQGVLARLVELDPDDFETRRELAHTRADLGELEAAIAGLDAYARQCVAKERYDDAARACREILALDPGRDDAQRTLESIEAGVLARRRARAKRVTRAARLALSTTLVVAGFTYEGLARLALGQARTTISRSELVEQRRYAEARALLFGVHERFPYSLTDLIEVRRGMRELTAKLGQTDPPSAPIQDL